MQIGSADFGLFGYLPSCSQSFLSSNQKNRIFVSCYCLVRSFSSRFTGYSFCFPDGMFYVIPIIILLIFAFLGWLTWSQLNLSLWISAVSSRVPVSFFSLIGMRIRGTPSDRIIQSMMTAQKAGLRLNTNELEELWQANGDLDKVISALARSKNANLALDFRSVRELELSKRDVDKIVNAVILARNGGLGLDLNTAKSIDLAGIDVVKIVRAVVTAKNAGLELTMDMAQKIDLAGRDVNKVLSSVIQAKNAGIPIDLDKAIQIDLSGRDLDKIIKALIAAHNAGLDLDLETAQQIEAAGRDLTEAVKTAIQTKIIEFPPEREVKALPIDGVEVKFSASITVKTNLSELLAGAGGDETLLSRVEQKLVSKISSHNKWQDVMQDTTEISNILEPEDGKKKIENAKFYLSEGLLRWEEFELSEQKVEENEKEMKKKDEEETHKRGEIDALKKKAQELVGKMEESLQAEGDEKGQAYGELSETEMNFLRNERKQTEYERANIETEIRRIQEEKHHLSLINKKLGEERKKIQDDAFNKFEAAAKEAVYAQEQLAASHTSLLTALKEIKEVYGELFNAYKVAQQSYESKRTENMRKQLDLASRFMEAARRKFQEAEEELKKGRNNVSIVSSKLTDILQKINLGESEFTRTELNFAVKKIEGARRDTVEGRNALEECLSDLEDAYKALNLACKQTSLAQGALQTAKKKMNLVRRDLNPARKELEENTIYHVISVEIKKIEIGIDKGALLEKEQNEADKEKERLKAELKRVDLELKKREAEIREMEAQHKLLEAEAKVNEALADAFKSGNLGALDYYRLKNLQADTKMRNTLGGEEDKEPNAH